MIASTNTHKLTYLVFLETRSYDEVKANIEHIMLPASFT